MGIRMWEKIMDKTEFWEHYCCVQRDIMGFPKGVPCDWCDEEDPNPFSIKVIVRDDDKERLEDKK